MPGPVRVLTGLAFAALLCAPALAEGEKDKTKSADPDRIICQKEEVLGSRLAVRKVCKTAAEWAELRREDRDYVDKIQRNTCVPGAGC